MSDYCIWYVYKTPDNPGCEIVSAVTAQDAIETFNADHASDTDYSSIDSWYTIIGVTKV